MKRNLLFTVLIVLSVTVFGQKIPFQGKLIESGTPVEGTRTFNFEIPAVGWSETHADVPVTDGLYFVVLGSTNPLPDSLFYGVDEQSLSITVDGSALSPVTLFKPLSSPFEGSELVVRNDEGTVVGELKNSANWNGQNGEVNVYGENGSKNITLGAISHWQTPGNNFGWMYLSNDEDVAKVTLGITPYHGVHGSGEFNLLGETSSGIHQGFNNYGALWDYPYIQMNGEDSFKAIELKVIDDGGTQLGGLNLNSEDGSYANYDPTGLSMNKVRIDNYASGQMRLLGPDSENIEMGGRHWEGTPDLPFLQMIGENEYLGIDLGLSKDNEGQQYGWINLMSENGKSLHLSPESFGVDKISLNTANQNGGSSGEILVHGNSTPNVQMGGQFWNNHDLGFLQVFTDKPNGEGWYYAAAMIQAGTDGTNSWGSMSLNNNGDQTIGLDGLSGTIDLKSQNGKTLHLSPESFGLDKFSMNTVNQNGGSSGQMFIHGNTTPNIQMGGQNWGNHDLGFFTIFTDKSDGNGWYHGAASIMANTNGTDAWGRLSLFNNGEERVVLNGENGEISLSGPNSGKININGPNSNNITIGSKEWENADLPWLSLEGTHGNNLMHLTAIGGDNEFGYLHLNSDDGSKSNISAFRIENRSASDQQIGYFDPYRVTFNDNGQEMTYNAWGISGSGPLSIANGVNISGVITLNGDTLHVGVSDKRYKTNIQSLGGNVLEKVELVRGVSYDWRKDEFPEKHFTNAKQIGVIAQELEAQFPELVKTNAEGYKSVNYDGLSAVLIEAVKELNAKVEKLESENTQLKAELSASASNATEIEQLKTQMDELFNMVQGQQAESAIEASTSTISLK